VSLAEFVRGVDSVAWAHKALAATQSSETGVACHRRFQPSTSRCDDKIRKRCHRGNLKQCFFPEQFTMTRSASSCD